jgi:hypothetical protein
MLIKHPSVLLLSYTLFAFSHSAAAQDQVEVGLQKQLLVDDLVIDEMSNLRRVAGQATKANDGQRVYSFGGEPQHNINENTENVLQIGTLKFVSE